MNKNRRERIQAAYETLGEVRDEEEEAYNNLPVSLQESERGGAMQQNIADLEEATCYLEDIIER